MRTHTLPLPNAFIYASLVAGQLERRSRAALLTQISGAARNARPARWVGLGERLRQFGHQPT